jgi:hypothetical protein
LKWDIVVIKKNKIKGIIIAIIKKKKILIKLRINIPLNLIIKNQTQTRNKIGKVQIN